MTTWLRITGLVMIIVGLNWLRSSSIPVAWEGDQPSYYFRGRVAVVIASVTIVLGLLLLLGVFRWKLA
jgi:hypothetical protein